MLNRYGHLALCLALCGAPVLPALSQTVAPETMAPDAGISAATLAATLMIPAVVDILREEGLDYGKTLEEQMFPGNGGARWQEKVSAIYEPAWMQGVFDVAFAAETAGKPEATAAAQTFFGSPLGQRILSLEIEARRTLLDSAAEDAARLRYDEMDAANDPRLAQVRKLAEVNELVESNVIGALNSNFAFYRGMAGAGALDGEMTEEGMLSDVWGQEESVRAETTDWLFPYLTLAYSSLTDEELAQYIAYSETPEGKALNIALFAAFDKLFVTVSERLGAAAARQMQGQDI